MSNYDDTSVVGSERTEFNNSNPTNDRIAEAALNDQGEGEARMTKAKWLACFALGLSYTTAFQQGACLGAIVKSIDEALGEFKIASGKQEADALNRSHGILQLDD
jgi:hypothetical protein